MKKKVFDILIIVLIVIISIFVGSPLRYNNDVDNVIISVSAFGLLIYKIIKKEYIKINIIDILIIVLSFSTFLSLIFNTYLRLSDTVEYIFRYITALNFYFIIRVYTGNNFKKANIITNTISVMSGIIIFFRVRHVNI